VSLSLPKRACSHLGLDSYYPDCCNGRQIRWGSTAATCWSPLLDTMTAPIDLTG
jgi:hypothetical protein